jgi:hypothetical protein
MMMSDDAISQFLWREPYILNMHLLYPHFDMHHLQALVFEGTG